MCSWSSSPARRRGATLATTLSVTIAVTLAIAASGCSPLLAQPPGRIVAVGDVHGSLDGLRSILRAAALVDATGTWTGGSATFVQTGDVTDRGADVRGALDVLMALERQAEARGGRVVQVLGNHEVMNLIGELRDVTADICSKFAGPDATATRERAWDDYARLQKDRARTRPDETPAAFARTKEQWLAAYPPGCVEYRLAMSPSGDYGKWLRRKPIAAQVGDAVFMHAGPDPAATAGSVADLNTRAAQEIARFDKFHARLVAARMARPWFRLEDVLAVAAAEVRWVNARIAEAKAKGEAPDLSGVDVELVREAADVLQIGTWSLLAENGPLWYRGYALADDATLAEPARALFARWRIARLVVGHTVNRDFRIRARLEGRVFLIDTGMLAPVYKGAASGLELTPGTVTAIYADGSRIPLTSPPPAP